MRRRAGLFLFCGLVLPLVIVANASAQGATLVLNPTSGPPGTPIEATGSGFSASNAVVDNPKIRFSTRDAPVLKEGTVSSGNSFTTTFPAPSLPPGEYLVLATQTSVRGRTTSGPGRAKFVITAGAASAASAPPGRGTSQATVALGSLMVALVLLAGGTLAVRRQRAHNRPLGS